MKTDLSQHYKDRDPIETVNIIRNFFESKGYTIEEYIQIESEINTYGCVIIVKWNDILLCRQSGKGMTLDYARASGYGELYERFCNNIGTLWSPILLHNLYQLNYKNHQYYYAPDEIEVPFEKLFENQKIKNQFLNIFNNNTTQLHRYIDIFFDKKYLQVPFQNLIDQTDKIYFNPTLLVDYTGSNGMAAGNTYTEAVNQAMAELYERYCFNRFLLSEPNEIFYEIDKNNIQNEELKYKINLIEQNGNTVHIIDLSYNYQYPVVLAIVLNHQTKNICINAGSFPIFDIALERVITEIYQNRRTLKIQTSQIQLPYKNIKPEYYCNNCINSARQQVINEQIFNQFVKMSSYNHNQYLSVDEYSNQQIFNWYMLKNKEHNNKVYVRDMSLCDKMSAVYLYSEELSITTHLPFKHSQTVRNINEHQERCLSIYKTIIQDSELFLENKKTVNDLIDDFNFINNSNIEFIDSLFNGMVILSPFYHLLPEERKLIYHFINRVNNKTFFASNNPIKDDDIYDLTFNWSDYQNTITKYLTLRRYLNHGGYSKEEIKDFFKELNQELSDEDFDLFENSMYLLFKMIFEKFRYLYGEHIEDILKGYL